jgi:ERCC4-type nuclease
MAAVKRFRPTRRAVPKRVDVRTDGDLASYLPAGTSRLRVMRDGHNILRSAGIPKPVVLVDTREQQPFALHARHPNWIGGERRVALEAGDYSLEGMEGLLALERKSLADIVACTITYRQRFLSACARLAKLRWKAILIEATLEDLKGGFEQFDIPSEVHPNAVCGMLDAIEARLGIPVLYTSRAPALATERAASWLSKHFTYWWLEERGLGRVLIDADGL